MARLYGEKENINSENVKDFFDRRAKKEVDNLTTITSLIEKEEDIEIKNNEERDLLSKKIDFNSKKILEIGCGIGRWTEYLHDKCDIYVGIDYSENLIKIAEKEFNYPNCYFKTLSATEIDKINLPYSGPYDIIFIPGVLMYINDEDIEVMIEKINKLIHENSIIYIREPISIINKRLTLKDFFSDELKEDYNAIYRTKNEYLTFFKEFKYISNIEINKIHEDINKHSETCYTYFLLK